MQGALWSVPLLPLAASIVLIAVRGPLKERSVATIGVGATALAALVACAVALSFWRGLEIGESVHELRLGEWLVAGEFSASYALRLDALSLVMMLVITGVGALILWYSRVYMAGEEGFARFFAYMNLFMAAMLVLVLSDNLLLLYLGWEGVGLCSYLLIGFWYQNAENGRAARKAFIVTRAGDTAMLIGLLLLATSLGTLEIDVLVERAQAQWVTGSNIANTTAALLLFGALGKSAQWPLQTWLPDAMAGPTPVSALIHAATMVTAGMYLIARLHGLFLLAPAVMFAVAIIGALTLLAAAVAALAQNDIKRILAYSTMSQIGYMFLALGAGAWTAALFHFMTHAFFKALLFLAAGALILALDHEQDIRKMGGLRHSLPAVFWPFLIGAASLASLPMVTAGFYSKEMILADVFSAGGLGPGLALVGVVAAFVTSVYIFRAVFIVFFGNRVLGGIAPDATVVRRAPVRLPLLVLSVLSLIAGLVETPSALGGVHVFSRLLAGTLPASTAEGAAWLALIAAASSMGGVALAYWRYFPRRALRWQSIGDSRVLAFIASGFGFDRLYERLVVKPYVRLATALCPDWLDVVADVTASALRRAARGASRLQTGQVRWYARAMLAGLVLAIAATLWM